MEIVSGQICVDPTQLTQSAFKGDASHHGHYVEFELAAWALATR